LKRHDETHHPIELDDEHSEALASLVPPRKVDSGLCQAPAVDGHKIRPGVAEGWSCTFASWAVIERERRGPSGMVQGTCDEENDADVRKNDWRENGEKRKVARVPVQAGAENEDERADDDADKEGHLESIPAAEHVQLRGGSTEQDGRGRGFFAIIDGVEGCGIVVVSFPALPPPIRKLRQLECA